MNCSTGIREARPDGCSPAPASHRCAALSVPMPPRSWRWKYDRSGPRCWDAGYKAPELCPSHLPPRRSMSVRQKNLFPSPGPGIPLGKGDAFFHHLIPDPDHLRQIFFCIPAHPDLLFCFFFHGTHPFLLILLSPVYRKLQKKQNRNSFFRSRHLPDPPLFSRACFRWPAA